VTTKGRTFRRDFRGDVGDISTGGDQLLGTFCTSERRGGVEQNRSPSNFRRVSLRGHRSQKDLGILESIKHSFLGGFQKGVMT